MLVRYPSSLKGYECYLPGKKGRVFVTIDVTLREVFHVIHKEIKNLHMKKVKGSLCFFFNLFLLHDQGSLNDNNNQESQTSRKYKHQKC